MTQSMIVTSINEHLADEHLRMPCVGGPNGDMNEEQSNLLFSTPIISFFMDHLFLSSQMWHRSFSKFANRIFENMISTQSFSHEVRKRFVALRKTGSSYLGFAMVIYCLSSLSQSDL
ncbi:hypothetical protein ACSQ67_010460 [Phaseolus vulgaris]